MAGHIAHLKEFRAAGCSVPGFVGVMITVTLLLALLLRLSVLIHLLGLSVPFDLSGAVSHCPGRTWVSVSRKPGRHLQNAGGRLV